MAFVLKIGILTPNGRHNSEYDAPYPHLYLNQDIYLAYSRKREAALPEPIIESWKCIKNIYFTLWGHNNPSLGPILWNVKLP